MRPRMRISRCVHQVLAAKLRQIASLRDVLTEIEVPLVSVFQRMERTGVRLDGAMLARQSRATGHEDAQAGTAGLRDRGHNFNMGSPKQIGQIFFEELKLPVIREDSEGRTFYRRVSAAGAGRAGPRTSAGNLSTAAWPSSSPPIPTSCRSWSMRHRPVHQLSPGGGGDRATEFIRRTRTCRTSRCAARGPAYPAGVHPGSGLAHARLPTIRRSSCASWRTCPGRRPAQAFAAGEDIHRATAAEVFGADGPEAVTADQRRSAKAINFGLIYGMSAFGLARQLGIERSAARNMSICTSRAIGVKAFMERYPEQACANGFVETLFGRRLYLPDIKARNADPGRRRAHCDQRADAGEPRPTSSSVRCWQLTTGLEKRPPVRMLMQVHDELVFEVETAAIARPAAGIRRLMEGAAELRCRCWSTSASATTGTRRTEAIRQWRDGRSPQECSIDQAAGR